MYVCLCSTTSQSSRHTPPHIFHCGTEERLHFWVNSAAMPSVRTTHVSYGVTRLLKLTLSKCGVSVAVSAVLLKAVHDENV